jgi:glycopeptide antibiotics resistance protein
MRFDLGLLSWVAGTMAMLVLLLPVLRGRGHTWSYVLSLFVVVMYLSLVARETLVYHSLPGDESFPYGFSSYVNLVPGRAGPNPWSSFNREQVFINILLGVPLGFGLNFLRRVQVRTLPWIALGFGFTIEALQLVSSLIVGHPRHIADINDLLLNAFGVALGYAVFRGIARVYSLLWARDEARAGGPVCHLAAVMARTGDGSIR